MVGATRERIAAHLFRAQSGARRRTGRAGAGSGCRRRGRSAPRAPCRRWSAARPSSLSARNNRSKLCGQHQEDIKEDLSRVHEPGWSCSCRPQSQSFFARPPRSRPWRRSAGRCSHPITNICTAAQKKDEQGVQIISVHQAATYPVLDVGVGTGLQQHAGDVCAARVVQCCKALLCVNGMRNNTTC